MKPVWDAEKAQKAAKANREEMIYLAQATGTRVRTRCFITDLSTLTLWVACYEGFGILGNMGVFPGKAQSFCDYRASLGKKRHAGMWRIRVDIAMAKAPTVANNLSDHSRFPKRITRNFTRST
jgi:hypothetical protein